MYLSTIYVTHTKSYVLNNHKSIETSGNHSIHLKGITRKGKNIFKITQQLSGQLNFIFVEKKCIEYKILL